MKKTFITLLLMTVAFSTFGQKMAEPEYHGQVNYVNTDSTVTLLEAEKTEIKAKSNGLSFVPVAGVLLGKGQSWIIAKGQQSNFQIEGDNARFIVRMKDNNEDPRKTIGIFKFEQKKKDRRYLLAEANLISVKNKTGIGDIKFEVKKHGEASFIVSLEHLEQGEYGIVTGEDMGHIVTFSVK